MRLRQRTPAEQVAYYEGVLARERVHLSALVEDAKKRRAVIRIVKGCLARARQARRKAG